MSFLKNNNICSSFMRRPLLALFNDHSSDVKGKIIGMYSLLLLFNIGAWLWAFLAFRNHPLLMGTAFLAYSFGLRHAVDADHIAAIDNVTRKLMQEGKKPVAVGFMFSLGHSSIVFLACVAIAATASAFKTQIDSIREVGGLIGTLVSVFFLLIVAIINLIVLSSVWQTFRRVRRGEAYVEEDMNLLLAGRGLLARLFRPMFRIVTRSWHMYPLGLLFGLGFDTATEIALLGISASEASNGLSIWTILVFPALFTAGMSLIDTTDSILMLGAYGWAFVKPIRKLYYNMTITLVSVIVAVVVSSLEILGLAVEKWHLSGAFWDVISDINEDFGLIGYFIIGLFIVSWLLSLAFYKWRRYDELDIAPASGAS
jgi:high-affinity nickel-transport protein